ncbi:MAG: response regulator transcription factor [Rhodospirillaceae bacterium]|nr:response regulator transcription factor [Rhodospirillaceae bacterium]
MTATSPPTQALPQHLLIVDDDPRLCNLLARLMKDSGYMVSTANDAAEARRHLSGLRFDLLIVDRMMPGEDGLSLIKHIRKSSDVPILMLTAMGEADQRIQGLEHGADDYMAKPFEPRELLLRVQSILRRAPAAEEPTRLELKFGECRYDLARHQLMRDGANVHLTASEAELLRILIDHVNEPVDRSVLAAASEDGANPRTIDVQITRLRRKLEADPRQPRFLQTVRGTGYLLRSDAP